MWDLRQHFQARGHSFSPYGPTLSQQITCSFQLAGSIFETTCKKVKIVNINYFQIHSTRSFVQQDPIVPVMTSLALEEVSNSLLGKTHQQTRITLSLLCPYWKQSQLPTTPPIAKAMELIKITDISKYCYSVHVIQFVKL